MRCFLFDFFGEFIFDPSDVYFDTQCHFHFKTMKLGKIIFLLEVINTCVSIEFICSAEMSFSYKIRPLKMSKNKSYNAI